MFKSMKVKDFDFKQIRLIINCIQEEVGFILF